MRVSISKVIVAGLAALATVAPLAPTTTSASAAGTPERTLKNSAARDGAVE
jgi:hypothetical protein